MVHGMTFDFNADSLCFYKPARKRRAAQQELACPCRYCNTFSLEVIQVTIDGGERVDLIINPRHSWRDGIDLAEGDACTLAEQLAAVDSKKIYLNIQTYACGNGWDSGWCKELKIPETRLPELKEMAAQRGMIYIDMSKPTTIDIRHDDEDGWTVEVN